jgi:predicted PurR-regulated permease PerM
VEHPDTVTSPPDRPAVATVRLTPRSVVRAVLLVAAMLALFVVATRATETLWWFAQAMVIAAIAYPAVQRMSRRMPAFVAVLVLTAIVAAVFSGLVAVALGELRSESVRFRDAVPGAVDRLERSDALGRVIADLHLDESIRSVADQVAQRTRFDGPDLPGIATAVGGRVSAVFVIWILSVMLVFTGPSMARSLVEQVPADARAQVDLVLRQAYGRTVRYLTLTALRSLAVGALTFVAATALGLDMPGMLSVVAALLAFVPYVGILAGGLLLSLMALLTSPTEAMAVLIVVLALQTADALVVQPAISARSLELGLFPTLVAAMIGYRLHGPGGLLVAVAVVAMLVAVVNDTGAVRSLREAAHLGDEPTPAGTGSRVS